MELDLNTEFGARVARRLENESVIWLVTVREDLTPQPTPVWFWWDGTTFLIYSQPNRQKLHNIERHPTVALHFDSNPPGDNIVVITGTARIDPQTPPATQVMAYLKKYRQGIADLHMTPETLAADYSVPVRVIPTRLRGF